MYGYGQSPLLDFNLSLSLQCMGYGHCLLLVEAWLWSLSSSCFRLLLVEAWLWSLSSSCFHLLLVEVWLWALSSSCFR